MKRRTIIVLGALALLVVVTLVVGPGKGSASTPFTPKDDAQVVERLATGASDPRLRELESQRRALRADPKNLALAVRVARSDIEAGRARSDPRYLGYAEAALAPWWDAPSPPPEVLVLRATIRQSTHDFDRALADLDLVVKLTPGDPQAWLTRSVVLTVRGEYDEARRSCEPLVRLTTALVTAVCFAGVDGVTGDAKGAYARLGEALAQPGVTASEQSWAVSTLGEIAARLGDVGAAENDFKRALAADPTDAYVLGAYADLLLDAGRPAEAATLVRDQTNNDALLLRLALAEAASHAPDAKTHIAMLKDRFDASHLRGDTVHRREEARFTLWLANDARKALALATANWGVQHEPWDVRVLLESALAAGEPAAAAPALAFLDAHHLEDPKIAAVAAKLRAGAK